MMIQIGEKRMNIRYTSNIKWHLELIREDPKSLSLSWILQAFYNQWKK